VWILLVLALGLGSWLGFRAWVNRSYFLGVEDGKVAIFRGLPTLNLNHIEKATPYSIEQIPVQFRGRLEEGIRVGSLAEARSTLAGILRDAGGAPTGTPTPSPSGTKT
jgi:protein phosphatase